MEFEKKAGSPEEFLLCTELLPAMRKRYSATFALLEIPEVLRSDRSLGEYGTIYFRNYDGEKYNGRWSEQTGEYTGGCALGTELSSEMVQLLNDLQQVDVDWLLSLHPIGERARASAFDLQGWLLTFQTRELKALQMGISADEFVQAEHLVNDGFRCTRRIVSNGDFYPRNLVKVADRIVLVDWGYWTGYRVCFVDYLVNVAAFAFIHMWNNVPWQKNFLRHVGETLEVESDDFRKAVLVKSFEQAAFWQNNPSLVTQVAAQVKLFQMALRNEIRF
jgi:hypothetical protein